MRSILIILFFMLIMLSAKSQSGKWQPGHFMDVEGNPGLGLIRIGTSGPGPVQGEGYIEFKENPKAKPFDLSASDIRYFVIGRDSFVVAHAPRNDTWAKNELDFVRVALDEDPKLYVARGGSGGRGARIQPELDAGIGASIGRGFGSGFGAGFGGGLVIPLGGGGGNTITYYYGTNSGNMHRLNNLNFEDIMSDMLGDEPEVVDKIHDKTYRLENIEQLIAYFKQVQSSHAK